MLSITQLTKRWKCGRDHIEKLIHRGLLQAFALNPTAKRPTWRIHKDSVTAFENSRQTVAR